METKIIDGKEYTKVAIKDLSINGEKNDNSFSVDNLNNQNEISLILKLTTTQIIIQLLSPQAI